ncbi:MAG TPA: YciI family protein [Labilithrix sp.]|jgi:hypothetical protein|nr:YciI family protein [Labilithrix sp.]
MRFMILVKATKESEAGALPEDVVRALGKYHEDLLKAGVLLAADGLDPSAKGARMTYSGEKRVLTHGPFAEARGIVAGYTMIQVRSRDEALEWFRRFPNPHPGHECEIELRQVSSSPNSR